MDTEGAWWKTVDVRRVPCGMCARDAATPSRLDLLQGRGLGFRLVLRSVLQGHAWGLRRVLEGHVLGPLGLCAWVRQGMSRVSLILAHVIAKCR